MFLHYLNKKENKEEENQYIDAYSEIINITKLVFLNKLRHKEKNFELTFEVFSIIIFCIFYSLNFNLDDKSKKFKQAIMNLFVNDLDHSFRLSGIADMKIGGHVKAYVKKFYFRLNKLNKILENNNETEFYQYLITFNIVKSGQLLKESQFLFKDLNILINRAKNQDFTKDLYKDLFN